MGSLRAAALLTTATLLAAGCGGSSSSPSAPADSTGWSGSVRIDLYHSALGKVGQTTRPVRRGSLLALSIAELGVSGVDAKRIVVRAPHDGSHLGRRIAWSTTGSVGFPAYDDAVDVFLMDNRRTPDYTCFDAGDTTWFDRGFRERYTTLRKVVGEILFDNYLAEDGPDVPFEWATQEFTRALNPYGLPYGRVAFSRGPAAMKCGWYFGYHPSWIGVASAQGSGVFWIAAGLDPPKAEEVAMHELAHAYLGAPDYYKHKECSGTLSRVLLVWGAGDWVLSPQGEDAIRYWSLMGAAE
jgi:hypothetical protein